MTSLIKLPVYAGNTWYVLVVTDSFCEKSVPDLPGKHGGVLFLVLADGVHHMGRGNLRFASPDHSRLEVARLVVSGELD